VKALIKIGGTLLDSAESRNRLAAEIAAAVRDGFEMVVVHGGGKQMTRFLAERGAATQFIDGLRVTTSEVLDAVLKVLAGSVNQELVAALVASGARAVGLTGMDALMTEARRMREDLGQVGEPVRSDACLLRTLIGGGFLPVVACVAGDSSGRFYNVNADQMAVSLAVAFAAQRLIFLTDVDGVRDAKNTICREITTTECRNLITSGVATGGMHTSDLDAGGVIDRILLARPKQFSEADIQRARGWMHTYAGKLPHREVPQPHPPDDTMVAQFLAVAPWPRLEALLYDLMAERKECGYNYAWFTSVALQRIHGIKPQALKEAREQLRAIRRGPAALSAKKRL